MILWANLIADIPPAMALGIDPAQPDILTRKPRNPKKGIFTRFAVVLLIFQGMSMALISLAIYLIRLFVFGDIESEETVAFAQGVTFIALTMIQLEHSFLSRSVHDTVFSSEAFKNKWIIGAFFLSTALLVAAAYSPGVQAILEQSAIGPIDWAMVVAGMALHVLFIELMKIYLRRRRRKRRNKSSLFYSDV